MRADPYLLGDLVLGLLLFSFLGCVGVGLVVVVTALARWL